MPWRHDRHLSARAAISLQRFDVHCYGFHAAEGDAVKRHSSMRNRANHRSSRCRAADTWAYGDNDDGHERDILAAMLIMTVPAPC